MLVILAAAPHRGGRFSVRLERGGFGHRGRAAPISGTPDGEPIQEADAEANASRRITPSTEQARIVDTAFQPEDMTVGDGSTIVWMQSGLQAHSVTAADESFASSPNCSPIKIDKCLRKGDDFSVEFTEPGIYDYYCRVHGLPDGTGMTGKITVED